MELNVLNKEKGMLEVQVDGLDEGMANYVAEKILEDKSAFAAVSLDHPLTGHPIIHVQSSSPKEALVSAIKAVEDEAKEASTALGKLKK